jgi:hypothetical protein
MHQVEEILYLDKAIILEGIQTTVINYLDDEATLNGNYFAYMDDRFKKFVVSAIKSFLMHSFSLTTTEVYEIDEVLLDNLVGQYYFERRNYYE